MSKLERVLTLRDLIFFNVVAIFGLRWVALAAASGPSSLTLWILAAIAFFIPHALCVATLSSSIPEEGGVYAWTTRAFGPRQGFLAAWCYWSSNIFYFPTLALSSAVFFLYALGPHLLALENSIVYTSFASLTMLGLALVFNILGLRKGRWLQNVGGIAQWLPVVILVAVGSLAVSKYGSATPMSGTAFLPALSEPDTVILFSQICFAFAGFELAPILAGEVVEPARTVPGAIIVSGMAIAACYFAATLALLWALPAQEVSIIAGVNQAIAKAATRFGLEWLGPLTALLMTVSGIGGLGAWLIGTARLPFLAGANRDLPSVLGTLHPKWGTPYVAVLFQASLAAACIAAAAQGSSVKSAYLILVNATLIVYFIPYLYMFAAAIRLQRRIATTPGAIPIPAGPVGSWVINGIGFVTTLLAILLALIPPSGEEAKLVFFSKVFIGSAGFVLVGTAIYSRSHRARQRKTP